MASNDNDKAHCYLSYFVAGGDCAQPCMSLNSDRLSLYPIRLRNLSKLSLATGTITEAQHIWIILWRLMKLQGSFKKAQFQYQVFAN